MSNDLITLLFWLSGWLLLSIGYFVYNVVIDHDHKVTKKVLAWRAFWTGFWSWIGIFFISVFLLAGGIALFNDWIKKN